MAQVLLLANAMARPWREQDKFASYDYAKLIGRRCSSFPRL